MRRIVNPFVILYSLALAGFYAYMGLRFMDGLVQRLLFAIPFACMWAVPIFYRVARRERASTFDHVVHILGYVSVGWLSFVLLFTIVRDLAYLATLAPGLGEAHTAIVTEGFAAILAAAALCLVLGAVRAKLGPTVRVVDVPVADLPSELDGFRIVQISDLHVGPTIRRRYVRRVVELANGLSPDVVALTGDIIDGRLEELATHAAPLAELSPRGRLFFVAGNHEYYSGLSGWLEHFKTLGFRLLLNAHEVIEHGSRRVLIGGVLDPAANRTGVGEGPDPERAAAQGPGEEADFRLLLAHNPKIAEAAEKAGFDLQLSGHTHGGQFFPWTLVTRFIHAPHFVGLSRRGKMWVYVSMGTGTWGPPVRFGTTPELTLIRLTRSA